MVQLTAYAIAEAKRLLAKQGKASLGIRVGVQGGGCSGLSYKLGFDEGRKGDHVQEIDGVRVFVDPKSELYLGDTILDFSEDLQGRGFKFLNPNAKKTCGCGESFSV
ncbi:MAG: hypothetical protein A3G87_06645 [Omnitrophica bacterium RIFCSPLOWO2_12_FULL_50_11]|nr:MAG: hypothetical protein A3G87_06645 [Omnitrophica bacterium RIFCSPLOWO2_12_FULL_50_11]